MAERSSRLARGDMHTMPANDLVDHDHSRTCWCGPAVLELCRTCHGLDADCWACEDGLLPLGDPVGRALVVHNAADGRE